MRENDIVFFNCLITKLLPQLMYLRAEQGISKIYRGKNYKEPYQNSREHKRLHRDAIKLYTISRLSSSRKPIGFCSQSSAQSFVLVCN